MEQLSYLIIWGALWLTGGWFLLQIGARSLARLFIYANSIRTVAAFQPFTDEGKKLISQISNFREGLVSVQRGYAYITQWILPSCVVALLLWIGLVVQYVFSLDFGIGYTWVTAIFAVSSSLVGFKYLRSHHAYVNAMWGLEVFRSSKYLERDRLTKLFDEASTFDLGPMSDDKFAQVALNLAKEKLTESLEQNQQTIQQVDHQIALMKSLRR